MKHNKLLVGATAATMVPHGAAYGLVSSAAIAIADGAVDWVGSQSEVPAEYATFESVDLCGRLVTPGLIDAHTHVVSGGNRSAEFEQRLNGASYEEVARAGGGILSTVRATREAGVDELVADALPRVDALIAEGLSTIEIFLTSALMGPNRAI
ncbi:hypothetical protein [Sulfitobacter sp.]|jgi:imidazolonepropionase|uniref:hypothetical protein n=1 Tax=Sulfitobacter sp. TaxID=1903071 RepID=UPI0039E6D10C